MRKCCEMYLLHRRMTTAAVRNMPVMTTASQMWMKNAAAIKAKDVIVTARTKSMLLRST